MLIDLIKAKYDRRVRNTIRKRCIKNPSEIVMVQHAIAIHLIEDVFLACGAKYYIAPNSYPEGNASLMYLLSFLYEYIQSDRNVELAHQISSQHSDDRSQFTLF